MKTGSLQRTDVASILEDLPSRRRVPISTYRLQLHKGFGFKDARAILPYLSELGITDCYTSPILKARPGSMHGYDICDHHALNPELGSAADYDDFAESIKRLNLGHLLDFVPNHMGNDPETNPWWRDVLENGPNSHFANYFDIYWHPIQPALDGKVLLPILGDQYGLVLERGELKLVFEDGAFSIHYFDHRFPIDPYQYPVILKHGLADLKASMKEEDRLHEEFLSVIGAFEHLPTNAEKQPERIAERQREKKIAQERLARVMRQSPVIREHVSKAITSFNGEPGHPETFDPLHNLLESQSYRLAYWKTAFHEINYRRFFDVNHLAGLRVENEGVFPATHELTMKLVAEGKITGLRIDHPDGLYDPAGYFEALQDMFLQEWVKEQLGSDLTPEQEEQIRLWRVTERKKDPKGLGSRPLYVAAEKILSSGEALDAHWSIDGTSGYDFLNDLNGIFVDSRSEKRMVDIYKNFTGKSAPFEMVAYVSKKLIMSTSLASELNVLAHALDRISERDRRSRDFTLDGLRDALKEVIACFPVYRTYINASRGSAVDRQIIEKAIAEAKRRNPAIDSSIFDFVKTVLTPENAEKVTSEEFRLQLWFAMKFQQYTGPLQAKGLEDTAFYRYNVLISLNDVGGDPPRFGCSPAEFHERNISRHKEWPYSMLATSTHDTKRGEDSRARLNVLSEIPEEWEKQVVAWSKMNADNRVPMGKEWAPDRNDEYLFYQALLGAWAGETSGPALQELKERLQAYMIKAVKEAKLHSSWISPNEAYETSVTTFVDKVLSEDTQNAFLPSFLAFAGPVSRVGMINSLSQVVLKIGSPGSPDFYQGSELWDLSLVDPDNRRSIDYPKRQRLLAEVQNAPLRDLLQSWEDGGIKLWVTAKALQFRQHNAELLLEGDYIPLEVEGDKAKHAIAFARLYRDKALLVVAPRLVSSWGQEKGSIPAGPEWWGSTSLKLPPELAAMRYRNIFTQDDVSPKLDGQSALVLISDLLKTFPVAMLHSNHL